MRKINHGTLQKTKADFTLLLLSSLSGPPLSFSWVPEPKNREKDRLGVWKEWTLSNGCPPKHYFFPQIHFHDQNSNSYFGAGGVVRQVSLVFSLHLYLAHVQNIFFNSRSRTNTVQWFCTSLLTLPNMNEALTEAYLQILTHLPH